MLRAAGEGRGVPNGIPLRDSDVTKTSRDKFCRADSEDTADTESRFLLTSDPTHVGELCEELIAE